MTEEIFTQESTRWYTTASMSRDTLDRIKRQGISGEHVDKILKRILTTYEQVTEKW